MSCWSAERKPWLILGKTIWAGVRDQEVRGGRGWRGGSLMKSQQKKEKVEEIKKHNNRLDQMVEIEDQVQCLQAWGEMHTFLLWCFLKDGLRLAPEVSITTSGVLRHPLRVHQPQEKCQFLLTECTVITVMLSAKPDHRSCTHWSDVYFFGHLYKYRNMYAFLIFTSIKQTLEGEICGETWSFTHRVTFQTVSWLVNLNPVYNCLHIPFFIPALLSPMSWFWLHTAVVLNIFLDCIC